VKTTIRTLLNNSKRQILRRLDKTKLGDCSQPVLRARNIQYEISQRAQGIAFGGIGAMHLLVRKIGLIEAINRGLPLLKIHMPYHVSDHVLNIAYNPLCNGTCLQDIELRRNNVAYLNALDAKRIPDPTTAGDFCRRFNADSINKLQDIFDDVRIGVWRRQPASFFEQAIIDADGSIVPTTGLCKVGMDIADWNYQPQACKQEYRLIVVRKNISKEKGELRLFDEIRYFLYLTNDFQSAPQQIVLAHERPKNPTYGEAAEGESGQASREEWIGPTNGANGRCHQENLIQQLKNGMHALKASPKS